MAKCGRTHIARSPIEAQAIVLPSAWATPPDLPPRKGGWVQNSVLRHKSWKVTQPKAKKVVNKVKDYTTPQSIYNRSIQVK